MATPVKHSLPRQLTGPALFVHADEDMSESQSYRVTLLLSEAGAKRLRNEIECEFSAHQEIEETFEARNPDELVKMVADYGRLVTWNPVVPPPIARTYPTTDESLEVAAIVNAIDENPALFAADYLALRKRVATIERNHRDLDAYTQMRLDGNEPGASIESLRLRMSHLSYEVH